MKKLVVVFALFVTGSCSSGGSSSPPPPPPSPVPVSDFTFLPVGQLQAGTGAGFADRSNYRPAMRFPLLRAKAYLNSQLYRNGGSRESAANPVIGVDAEGRPRFEFNQCDASNFSYPWRDTFCETRTWNNVFCPAGKGHQGMDIRGASCKSSGALDMQGKRDTNVVVAVESGTVIDIAPHLVKIQTDDQTTHYNYLHMDQVSVDFGDRVVRGQRIGRISNLGRTGRPSTTRHLHFEMKQNIAFEGDVRLRRVNPYTSLVAAYQRLLAGRP